MSEFADAIAHANATAETACEHARAQRSYDVRAGIAYGKAAELVEGKPTTLTLCVRNSIECFMRGQNWFAAEETAMRWRDDSRLAKSRAYLEQCRAECEAKIAEAT